MKGFSMLCLIGAVDSIVFAAEGKFVLAPGDHGGLWWLADVAVACAAVLLANVTWVLSWRRAHQKLIELRDAYRAGEISDTEYRSFFQQCLSEFA